MIYKYLTFLFIATSSIFCRNLKSSENWIEYNQITKIDLGMNKHEVISILGDPILILADTEFDDALHLFYNYKIAKYEYDNGRINTEIQIKNNNRYTLLKFIFIEDKLASWTEDNVTLGMAKKISQPKNSLMPFISYLINIVLLLKFF